MKEVEVKVKKLRENAIIPEYKTDGAAGFDLHAADEYIIPPGATVLVSTGISVELPFGLELQIRPRSGVSSKTHIEIPNSPGTIDSDYRGEVKVLLKNTIPSDVVAALPERVVYLLDGSRERLSENVPRGSYLIRKGDRIAQGVIQEVPRARFVVVEELSETERGSGGFGHTGV